MAALERLEGEADRLPPRLRLVLAEHLLRKLRATVADAPGSITWAGLDGLGRGVWDKDAQDHVNLSREQRI